MVTEAKDYTRLSHTRGVPLENLTSLCCILQRSTTSLNVRTLANEAIYHGVFNAAPLPPASRLPTRINHHMIALRDLGLVESVKQNGQVYYCLTPAGDAIVHAAAQTDHQERIVLTYPLRAAWRPVLVGSSYVRYHWLKYFMPQDTFSLEEFVAQGTWITLYQVPTEERYDEDDSGWRLESEHWEEQELNEFARKEIYEGLRRWTNEAFLTDDRVPEGRDSPFVHQSLEKEGREIESHVVKAWLDPAQDVAQFEELLHAVMDIRNSDRIAIPDLMIEICQTYDYSKFNIRELLTELYYERGSHYFFERGSNFLIHQAFNVANPEDYYVQLEGVWRTGLVRY